MAVNGNVADDKLPSVEKEQAESPVRHESENGSDDPEKSMDEPSVAKDDFEPVVTLKTWIVCVILSLGYGLSFWAVPVMAAIGSQVSTELGDPTGYVWYIPAWTIAITVSFLWFGPNSDLLGRRWFLVTGNLITTVGHIVVASAKTSNQIIAGMVIIGFGGALCQMAAFALPELLPNKWRHIGVVLADFVIYITVIVAPVTARYGFQFRTWQWNYWSMTIFQFLSFLGLLFLYFPPAHPAGTSIPQTLKELDYVGMLLFAAGAVPVLMGIVWAGIYSSSDAHVVAPLVVGFALLTLFALWETFVPKHPITPRHIFVSSWGRDFTAPAIALGVVNMFYYSSSIIWPTMITVFYTNGGTNWKYAVVLSLPQGFAITTGAILLTVFGSKIKHWQWQLTGASFIMVLFGSLLGLVTPHNKSTMIAFVFLSQMGFGYAIYLAIAITQMGVQHKDLGIAGGISGTFRFAAGAIGTAVYTTVLDNTLASELQKRVPPAATAVGVPASQLPGLFKAISGSTLATSFSPSVVEAVTPAINDSYCRAIFVVAMTSMAFGIAGLVACASCKDVDKKMNKKIEVYLENTQYADRNKFH